MSEEILRALMEMFALIVKQDGGMLQSEKDFVSAFLKKHLPYESADEYMRLFLDNAGPVQEKGVQSADEKPSVKDSLKIFNICQTINKTLTQPQRVIALVRAFELIDSDKQYTPQRMNIVNTIAEVFKVSPTEFHSIWAFIRDVEKEAFDDPAMIVIDGMGNLDEVDTEDSFIVFLKVASVNLYFLRCFCDSTPLMNGLPIVSHKIYTFAQGSSVMIPPFSPIYYGDVVSRFSTDTDVQRITFVADGLTYLFPDGSPAISNISFSASEGQLIGIMGASGTGKTTLLNLLSGLTKPYSGDVRINGKSIFTAGKSLDGVIGFVSQDDLLVEDLTVSQNLTYAASLCFAGKSRDELMSVVDRMLHTLGLYEKRDLRVGSPLKKVISGGQRKRLNIALELIREPSILFLDEPTTGLSSLDSENVMDLIHELTRKGKLVVSVVHQPSSSIFKGFEKVIILDSDGQMVFMGNPIDAIVHFKTLDAHINRDQGECPTCGTVNAETLFNILESRVIDEFGHYTDKRKISSREWAEAFRKKHPTEPPEEETASAHSNLQRPGWLKQMSIFLSRDIRSKLANHQYLLLALLVGPLLGLVLSYIIKFIADPSSDNYIFRENENIPVYIFMSVIVALFLGLTISAQEIFRDRKMLKREHFMHLSRSGYLIAKIAVLVLISAIQTLLFLVVANSILEIRDLFFEYWLALFATSLCANMIGLNISSAFNSPITIYIVIPLLMIPMMVLSGAMFPFDKLNRNIGSFDKVPFIAELMPTRWTYEALMVKQFTGNAYGRLVYDLQKQISHSDINTIYRIPKIKQALEITMGSMKDEGRESLEKGSLPLLRNETRRLGASAKLQPFPGQDSLTSDLFSFAVGKRLADWIDSAENEFIRQSNEADLQLDRYISLNKKTLSSLYNTSHNDKLEDIMKKLYEKNKIHVFNDRIIQNVDPIYLDPEPAGPLDFRTHFMSPVKKFMGTTIETYSFNIILVLLTTVVLYILLYMEVLRKLVDYFEGIRLQKNE
jgi:ABC-type multidrug transport system ATPase subunit/ABC-type multidrug transport system permease subunit